jgi:hypothetical protein
VYENSKDHAMTAQATEQHSTPPPAYDLTAADSIVTPQESRQDAPRLHDPGMTNDPVPRATDGRREIQRCEVLKRNGDVCGRYVATLFLDGLWRCPSHRPRNTVPRAPGEKPQKLPKPPVTALTTPADAVALSSWAAIQTALGRLDHQRANSITASCRAFRLAYAAADTSADTLRRLTAIGRGLEKILADDPANARAHLAELRRFYADTEAPEAPAEPTQKEQQEAERLAVAKLL